MSAIEVIDLAPAYGSEIRGLDPGVDIDETARRELRRLFDERSVLLLRGVAVDQEAQDRLCRLVIGDDRPAGGPARVERHISNVEPDALAPYGRLLFHADMMWHPNPFRSLSLYAVQVEPGAASTSFASGVHAWETLPLGLRERIEGLHVLHVTGQIYERGGDDLLRPERSEERSTITPIVQRHPRTGRLVLYVSQQMTREIVGLPHDVSESLLGELFEHLYAPSNVIVHEWRTGDLVVFDNLAVQHSRGNVERDGPARTLRKVIAPAPSDLSDADRPTFAGAQGRR